MAIVEVSKRSIGKVQEVLRADRSIVLKVRDRVLPQRSSLSGSEVRNQSAVLETQETWS